MKRMIGLSGLEKNWGKRTMKKTVKTEFAIDALKTKVC